MKRNKMVNVLLILLPVMAVALASTVDSVTVYDAVAGKTETYSYFSLVPNATMQILSPVAALLCVAAAVLAVISVAGKKVGCARWLKWISFAAAVAAVAPILLRNEQLIVVPNPLLPLLMMVEYVLGHMKAKTLASPDAEKARPAGQRLG